MNTSIVVCLFSLVALALARPEDKYTNKYDNTDLDEILSNKRLLEAYVNCILDKGKCTADGKELKEHIREALETKCSKCTEAQQKGTRKVIKYLIDNEPELWKEIKEKYDPEDIYVKKYEEELKSL